MHVTEKCLCCVYVIYSFDVKKKKDCRDLCNETLFTVLVVIVSSSPEGEFNCTSGGSSLPAGLVCDFKEDCEDGSDEEFCGILTVQEIKSSLIELFFNQRTYRPVSILHL